jgi:hypothetical protein
MRSGALPALALLASLAPGARADGRPPVTNGVFFQPGDARSIFVRSTFGLLVSRDAGCSFRWICEAAVGYGGGFDPKYAVGADGTIFAATFTGLRVSRDRGCTWRTATDDKRVGDPGRIAGIWVDALAIGPGGDVWIATADSGRPNDVYRSTDNGETFQPRNVRSATIWWKSVQVAPSSPRRVYITGYQVAGASTGTPLAHFLRSDDSGGRWTPSPIANVRVGATPIVYASAVDPANADLVLMTSAGANPPAGDRLYRTTDGGRMFQEVLATSAAINGVVFHGGQVYVSTPSGAFRSADGGAAFERVPDPPQLGCLGSHGGQLLGCGANWRPDDKAVARSADGGASWEKLLRFGELAGPLACGPGTTVHDLCEPVWPGLQRQFGAISPACAAEPEPPPKPGPAPKPERRGGCCDTGGGGPLGTAALLAWLGLAARRRRARRLEP